MQEQIQVWFQELFSFGYGFFDIFFAFITFFGEELFLIVLLPIFYWTIDKKTAFLIGGMGIFSMAINGAIKDIAKVERSIENENIRFVEIDNFFVSTKSLSNSYSFPSGHAQLTSSILLTAGFHFKNKRFWIFAIVMSILVGMSRIYLGVHWPLDVLIGILLGFVSAYFGYKLFIKCGDKRLFLDLSLIALAFILIIFAEKEDTFKGIGALFGLAIGSICESYLIKFDPKEGTVLRKIFRCLLGFVFVFAIKEGLKIGFEMIGDSNFFHLIRYFLVMMAGLVIYPMFFKKVRL